MPSGANTEVRRPEAERGEQEKVEQERRDGRTRGSQSRLFGCPSVRGVSDECPAERTQRSAPPPTWICFADVIHWPCGFPPSPGLSATLSPRRGGEGPAECQRASARAVHHRPRPAAPPRWPPLPQHDLRSTEPTWPRERVGVRATWPLSSSVSPIPLISHSTLSHSTLSASGRGVRAKGPRGSSG